MKEVLVVQVLGRPMPILGFGSRLSRNECQLWRTNQPHSKSLPLRKDAVDCRRSEVLEKGQHDIDLSIYIPEQNRYMGKGSNLLQPIEFEKEMLRAWRR